MRDIENFAFLAIFFEAMPARKEDFLAQSPRPDEVIATWPENLETELFLCLQSGSEWDSEIMGD
jgi:hypothetical protein